MSLLFGMTMKAGKPQYSGLQLQTSAANVPVPIVWGQNRIAPNLIWYGDFQAVKKKQKAGKGGVTTEYYEYTVSVCLGLCEGEILDIVRYWKDQSKIEWSDISNPFSLFVGSDPQSPWGYLTANHPDQALNYAGVAYVAAPNYNLGQSANLGQHSFEVKGREWGTAANGLDADPAIVVDQFLTNDQFGATFPASSIDYDQLFSSIDAPTTGDSCYQTYCRAINFGLSPILTAQEQGLNVLDRWARLTNSAVMWNGDKLKMIPYGDEEITANGVTFLPPTAVAAALGYNDFLGDADADPLTLTRSDPAEAYNSFKLEIRDKDFEYNNCPVEWKDQNLIEMFGLREQSSFKAEEVTDKAMAAIMVSLMGQRLAYVRNEYQFQLGQNHILIEPMDIVTVNDPGMGTVALRIKTVEEGEEGQLSITAEEFNEGVGSSSGFSTQANEGGGQNQAEAPGPVNTPVIWEPPLALSNGINQIWVAVSGGDDTVANPNWGGAIIYASLDDVNYQAIGSVETPATMGKLSGFLAAYVGSNPDTGHTAEVDMRMSGIELEGTNSTGALNGATLAKVGSEYLSYEAATLTGTLQYDLDTLYRGLYGSTASSHAIGSSFVRCNDSLFKYNLPAEYVGQTVYLKFQSVNIWNTVTQDLAECVAYTYVPTGGGAPSAPANFVATGGYQQNVLQWDPASGNSISYEVYAYHGTTTSFGLATLLATVNYATYVHAGLGDTDAWTYWVVATGIGGSSSPAGPQNATTITP